MWSLFRKKEAQAFQHSFVGGKPALPAGMNIPICQLCGNRQTFMFQVALPDEVEWSGRSLASFFCTQCANQDFLIPEMLPDHRRGCNIPDGFLTSYQRNFAFLVFPTFKSSIVEDYEEQVAFYALDCAQNGSSVDFGQIGGSPDWLLDDESPATYRSSIPMSFLFHLKSGIELNRVPGAKSQIELDLHGNPSLSPLDYYQLFLGNALYLFGTTAGEPLVYAVTQVE